MPRRRWVVLTLFILPLLWIVYQFNSEDKKSIKNVDFSKRIETKIIGGKDDASLRFAIAAVVSPKKTFFLYQDMLNYIGEKLDRPIKLIQRTNYGEINLLIKSGYIDIALICSGAYIFGENNTGMDILVVPKVYGKSEYQSYIIVQKDSDIETFEDLKGKTFAFSDPLSNSGKLFPSYKIYMLTETPESFFKEYIYTYSHDNSINAIARGIVDGAAVDSLIWEYENETNPSITSNTRIIEKSPFFAINPIVTSKRLDSRTKTELKNILLNMHKDPTGQRILQRLKIDSFVLIKKEAYDSIRMMYKAVNRLSDNK